AADEVEPRASLRGGAFMPVQDRRLKRLFRKGIGNFGTDLVVGCLELGATAPAHRFRQSAMEVAEKPERRGRSPFLAHEQERRHRGEQGDRQRSLERRAVRLRREPIAKRTVADLIMILQKVDEGSWRQAGRAFATTTTPTVHRRLTLVGETRGQRTGKVPV